MNDLSSSPKRGGARPGAGRKKGSSVYGESTRALRVPESLVPEVQFLLKLRERAVASNTTPLPVSFLRPAPAPSSVSAPLFNSRVAAGFPSPADDYVEKTLDLNELLVQKPAATFFVRAEGHSMIGAGIHNGDILVVDRSLEAKPGRIVICALNGELTVKRLASLNGQPFLQAENPDYSNIPIHEDAELVIWGVVTNVIHSV